MSENDGGKVSFKVVGMGVRMAMGKLKLRV